MTKKRSKRMRRKWPKRLESPHKREQISRRMCQRTGKPFTILYMDYRYWQCKRCGFDPEDPDTNEWFWGLHWTTRDTLVRMSRFLLIRGPLNSRARPS